MEHVVSPAVLQVQDPEVARIFMEGVPDRDALSGADRQRFDCLMTIMFAGHNQHYEFVRDGLSTPDAGEEMNNLMRLLAAMPGARQWWREWGQVFPEGFRSYAEGLMREAEAAE